MGAYRSLLTPGSLESCRALSQRLTCGVILNRASSLALRVPALLAPPRWLDRPLFAERTSAVDTELMHAYHYCSTEAETLCVPSWLLSASPQQGWYGQLGPG